MQFKVLNSWAIPGKPTEYGVFTLGIATEWRLLHGGPLSFPQRGSVCIDGVVYFRSWRSECNSMGAVLVAFDVGSESFSAIGLPQGAAGAYDERNSDLIQYKGKLVIVDYRFADHNAVRFWEFRTEHWATYTRLRPFDQYQATRRGPNVFCCWHIPYG